jgi:ABC-type uncharacterized transport system ATPase subunit
VEDAEIVRREPLTVHYRFDRRRVSAEALVRRVTEKCSLADIAITEPDIENIVRGIYVAGYA